MSTEEYRSQLLISSQNEKVIELSNGCICCTINDNLAQTIYEILDRPHLIDNFQIINSLKM